MNPQEPHDIRRTELEQWLAEVLGGVPERVAPASADASFRRYFRAWHASGTFIVMDAPPGREDLEPYVVVARLLAESGLNVPAIMASDRNRGFLLLSDLGDAQYLPALLASGANVDGLYADAIDALVMLQARGTPRAAALPAYDRTRLLQEMELLPQWFLARHLGLQSGPSLHGVLQDAFQLLATEALRQPQVLVHRDYHSRNLMVCPGRNPGILDFQDAVTGPVTYDLVSLLKDCYVTWPLARRLAWLDRYLQCAAAAGIDVGGDRDGFIRQFDLMGLQRHLKVLGIFCRLRYRDGKAGYLADLPRVLAYTLEVTRAYPELGPLDRLLHEVVVPAFAPAQARAAVAS